MANCSQFYIFVNLCTTHLKKKTYIIHSIISCIKNEVPYIIHVSMYLSMTCTYCQVCSYKYHVQYFSMYWKPFKHQPLHCFLPFPRLISIWPCCCVVASQTPPRTPSNGDSQRDTAKAFHVTQCLENRQVRWWLELIWLNLITFSKRFVSKLSSWRWDGLCSFYQWQGIFDT